MFLSFSIRNIIPLIFILFQHQIRNFSTMCKIEMQKKASVKKSCIRGFTGHYWLPLMSKLPSTQRIDGRESKKSSIKTHDTSRELCDVCGQSFSCVGNLNRHKILHTEYERLQCDVCLRTYSNKTNFTIHIQRHHPNFGIDISFSPTTVGAKKRPNYSSSNTVQH